jgi:hypothetical protein
LNLPKTEEHQHKSAAPSQGDSQEIAELKEVVSAWPRLTDPLKAAVLALVRTAVAPPARMGRASAPPRGGGGSLSLLIADQIGESDVEEDRGSVYAKSNTHNNKK